MSNNKHINILIVEDEAHNSRMLQGLIQKIRPQWKIMAILESVEDTVNWLVNNENPDLIMMDIQLSDGICFSIFEQVQLDASVRIIFTTAYDEYAIRAFKVNSIDYLLKPIEENDLEQAFQKFEILESSVLNDDYAIDKVHYKSLIESILQGKKEYRQRFLISGINSYQKLVTKNIAYIYSDNKVTFAVDFDAKEYTLDYNLEQLENELDPEQFFRANRKLIVNIVAVTKVNNEIGNKLKVELTPQPNFEIIVSRLKAGDFKIWLGK